MNTELRTTTSECAIALITTAQSLAHLFVCLSRLAYLLGQLSRSTVDAYVASCEGQKQPQPLLPYFQPVALLAPAKPGLEGLSIRELKALAKGKVKRYSSLNKPQLILALAEVAA